MPTRRQRLQNLRKFLLRVRERQAEAGVEVITGDRNHTALADDLSVDVARFQELVSRKTGIDVAELCDVYRGDLLEGFDSDDAEFSSWLRTQRASLREAFIGAVASCFEPLEADSDKVTLRIAARRLLDVDPYNEVGHRALMRLFAEDGEPTRVRDVYRGLETKLRQDLGVAPDVQTTILFEALQASPAAARPVAAEIARPASPAPAPVEMQSAALSQIPAAMLPRTGTPRLTILPPSLTGGLDYLQQLATSLIEDVTIGLCRFKAISMIAPHTAWELSKDARQPLIEAFHIDYVVETSLLVQAGDPRLVVKLVNAGRRDIIWSEHFPLEPRQMAKQYQQLSRFIVTELIEKVERIELQRYEREQDPTAYHLFLMGQRYLRTLDLPNIRRARRAFKTAIAACADFVPAINGLAQTYNMEWLLMARGDTELLNEAQRLAERSLEIDPDDSRGFRNLGLSRLYSGMFDDSLEAFAQAERRNPQHADLLADFADALQHSCEAPRAMEKISAAIELNPISPDRYWWVAGDVNFHLERYDEAIGHLSRMRDKSPAYRLIAASWAMLGEREKAGEYVSRAKEIHPDFSVNNWLKVLPIRDPQFAQRYEEGLRLAGFD